ncbi:phosphoadenosine phosphosulfate reductase [Jannaschia sp. 2305UL9-9]|uniref:phosphoadenosine phosphosulfate reductase n=1 Tax=Jannaschia sp. 2305UL9-9 TaxID=3121638 RepID=UPI003529ACD6
MSQPETSTNSAQTALRHAAGEAGWLRDLGTAHQALFRPLGATLLVEFDTAAGVTARKNHLPWSTGLAGKRDWSTLTVLSKGRTWFRAPEVIAFFDDLTDEGFFDDFDSVIFAGAGVGGYAAAAFSLAAPGATVFLVTPYATLDPDITPWERRFRRDRAIAFGPRYGYAPDMLQGAGRVFVISDPTEIRDSMHASLFRGPHITHLRAPHGGGRLAARLEAMGILDRLVAGAESGALTPLRWAQLWRARHRDPVWQANVLRKLDGMNRPWLQAIFAGSVLDATGSPAASRRLNDALAALAGAGRSAPAGRSPAPPKERDRLLLAGE